MVSSETPTQLSAPFRILFRILAVLLLCLSVPVFGGLILYPLKIAVLLVGSSLIIFLLALFRPGAAVALIVFSFAMIPMVPTNLGVANASMPSYFLLAFAAGRALRNLRRAGSLWLSGTSIDLPLVLLVMLYWVSCIVSFCRYTLCTDPVFLRDFFEILPRVFFYREGDLFLSFSAALQFTLGVVFFYSVLGYVRKEGDRKVYLLLYSALIPILFFSFYQAVTHRYIPQLWRESGRINGTFPDPNSFGAYLATLLFLFAIGGRRVLRLRKLGCAAGLVILVGVVLTGSRAAWAGCFVGATILLVQAFLRYWSQLGDDAKGRRVRRAVAVAAMICLLAFTAGYELVLRTEVVENQRRGGIVNRFLVLFNRSDTFNHVLKGRPTFWYTALNMTKQYPLSGVGAGLYREVMPQFLEKGQAYWWEVNKENAHNQFLQVSGEMGLIGLFVFVWVCVEIWAAYRRVRASGAQYESRGPAFALLVFGITALGAHPMIQMEIQVLFWILAALLFQSRSLLPEATLGRGPSRQEGPTRSLLPEATLGRGPSRQEGPTRSLLPEATLGRGPSRQEGLTWILAIGLFVVYAISGAVMARSFPPYHVYDLGMNSWEGKPWAEYFRWTKGSSLILLPRKFPHTKVKIELGRPAMGPDHSVSYRYQVDGDPPVKKTIGQHESQELLIDMVERTGNYVPLRVWVMGTWNKSRLPGSTDDRTLGIRVHAPEDREYLLETTEGLTEPETFEGDSGRRFDGSRAFLETFPDGRTILLPVFVEESAVGSRLRVYAGLDHIGEAALDKPGWSRHHFRGHYRLDQPLLLTFRLVGTDTSPPLIRGVGGIALGRIIWLP